MENYDISQNCLDSYQDYIYSLEEEENGESEDIDYDELDFSEPNDEETFRAQNEEFDKQMELERRPFVSWHLSKCCQNISESMDILEKRILKKPYYGMMIKNYNDFAREPLDDILSIISYEREKRRLEKRLAKQNAFDKKK